MRFKQVLTGVLLAAILVSVPVLAHATDTSVDLQPIANEVINFVFAAIGGAAIALLRRAIAAFERRTKITVDAHTREYLEAAIKNGVALGQAQVARMAGKLSAVDVKSEIAARAIEYVQARVPDALKHFKLSGGDLRQLIEARL